MNKRCENPSKRDGPYYKANGITVCEKWHRKNGSAGFAAFFADMGARPGAGHSLDRVDNLKGYTPENCRWATKKQQMSNTNRVKLYTVRGVTGNLTDLAEQFCGLPPQYVWTRINRLGWDIETAFTAPKSNRWRRGI